MAIKTLAADDKAERSTKVSEDEQFVTCTRTVKVDEDSPVRSVVVWAFDLADVTMAELIQFAARSLVIDTQRVWRGAKDRNSDAWGTRTIKVREMIDSARTRVAADPATQAARAVTKMSDTEKQALIDQITAELEQ